MSHFKNKKVYFEFFSHFFLFSFLLWFSYCLNTRDQDQSSFFFLFFLLQHWRKPIINTFFAVSEPKYFLFFLWHGGVGRPKKKFVCVTNLVLELTMGVVRWNLNLRVLNLLVTETIEILPCDFDTEFQKLQTGRKGFWFAHMRLACRCEKTKTPARLSYVIYG